MINYNTRIITSVLTNECSSLYVDLKFISRFWTGASWNFTLEIHRVHETPRYGVSYYNLRIVSSSFFFSIFHS